MKPVISVVPFAADRMALGSEEELLPAITARVFPERAPGKASSYRDQKTSLVAAAYVCRDCPVSLLALWPCVHGDCGRNF